MSTLRRITTWIALATMLASPLVAGRSHHSQRKPDRRPNHKSKHKMVVGQGSSHRGGHFRPGAHKDKIR